VRTRVGYAGGTTKNPTYHNIGDHSEAFQVDYDPKKISYGQLLDVVWKMHNPCSSPWSTQYKSIVFFEDAEQEKAAKASAAKLEVELGRPVLTEIRKLDRFYPAEDYHQKWNLRRNRALTRQLMRIYGGEKAFVDSTAAARINAYLGGYLDYAALKQELARLGLRAVGTRALTGVEVIPAKKPETPPEKDEKSVEKVR